MTAEAAIQFSDVQLSTGVRLRCAQFGPSDAPPCIMLHGYSDSWFSFSRVLELLPLHVRFIIPDQRGHGDSERPHGAYTPEIFARDAIALLDALGIASATVVGHSLGSFVAQQVAVLAPERVNKVVLVSSAGTARNDAVRNLTPAVEALTDPVDVDFVRDFQMSTVYRPVPAWFMDRAITESLKLPSSVWKAVLAGMLELPFIAPAGAIRCPVSVIWGDRDEIFGRADQEQLLRHFPGATLTVMSEVGHAPNWEAPQDFVRELRTAIIDE